MENKFKFINQKDIYQYKFYMIPKELFVNERYNEEDDGAYVLNIDAEKKNYTKTVKFNHLSGEWFSADFIVIKNLLDFVKIRYDNEDTEREFKLGILDYEA